MNVLTEAVLRYPSGPDTRPTSLAPAASVDSPASAQPQYKFWRCPVCGFHGCRKVALDAALDLKGHMLNFHEQWIRHDVAMAALTDQPQTAGSIMELEPTNLPAEALVNL